MNIKNTYFGFTNNLNSMQKAKIEKSLNNLIRYKNKIMTAKEFIYTKLQEGAIPYVEENYSYYSTKINDYTKPKNDYRLKNNDDIGSFHTINKTWYDYACYLLENNFLNEQKAQEFITAEQIRIQAEKQAEIDKQAKKEAQEKERLEFENWLHEQAERYNNMEKLNLAKEVFLSELGQYNESALREFIVLVENIDNNKCKEKLISWLHSGNKTSKKLFYHLTGIKLSNTDKETITLLKQLESKDFIGIIPYKKKHEKVKYEMTNTFYILVSNPKPHFEAVTGEYIKKYNLDLFITETERGYNLNEAKSGTLITSGRTKQVLFDNLKNIIDKIGIEKVESTIQDFVKKYGLSPKYTG